MAEDGGKRRRSAAVDGGAAEADTIPGGGAWSNIPEALVASS